MLAYNLLSCKHYLYKFISGKNMFFYKLCNMQEIKNVSHENKHKNRIHVHSCKFVSCEHNFIAEVDIFFIHEKNNDSI